MATQTQIDALKKDEGFRKNVYKDTRGILHIGIGYNLEKSGAREDLATLGFSPSQVDEIYAGKRSISQKQADALFDVSLSSANRSASEFTGNFKTLPQDIKDVLVNMSFQLGRSGLREFDKFKEALEDRDFVRARKEMLNSKWAKQTPSRAKRLASTVGSTKTAPKAQTALAKKLTAQEQYKRDLRDQRISNLASVMNRESMVDSLSEALSKSKTEVEEQ